MVPLLITYYNTTKDLPLDEEGLAKMYELSPLDEEGGARIDALPAIGADETWTVCVYIVGSNLEDQNENDLSYVTAVMTADQKQLAAQNNRQSMLDRLTRFSDELAANGLELPAFYYYPEKPIASSTYVTEDVTVAKGEGCASADIREMTDSTWSDNIRIVIQTGGATRWSNELVNPNRTQRFLYEKGEFTEVSNLPLQPSSETGTLAEFIRFCRDEYPSDHRILVLWNHGGGPFGYGNDSIFNGAFTLKDIRDALEQVYRPNSAKPAFDIIGFDACLMSTLEVTHALDGFADYYCLSEESEPGDGWTYNAWLQAMTDDPTMNAAQVSRKIADSYTDHYMTQNVNQILVQNNVTFSVLDARKASELYDAYGDLCDAQLRDAVSDISVLADIGRCGSRSTRFGNDSYNIFNTVDLGNYVDYMIDSYPEECSRIKDLIGETVLYHRENGALSDSTGIAVYLPSEVSDLGGLLYYLDYVYDISEDAGVSALYFYKQAGCLNDEMKEYVLSLTDAEPEILDVTPFHAFSKAEPVFDSEGFSFPVNEKLQSLMINHELELGLYDEADNTITYYGRNAGLYLDGEGSLCSDFDGSWICLNGQPLSTEIVSDTPSATEYRAHVLYNSGEAYLMLSLNKDTDEVTVTGVRKVDSDDAINYFVNTRSNEQIETGARIVPLYLRTDFSMNTTSTVEGNRVIFSGMSDFEKRSLPDGYYLATAVIGDQRGDSYYSAVVAADIRGGAVKEWKADNRFYGRDY